MTLVNSVNPFRLDGQKTAAFEICDDLGRAPDVLAIPVGNAGNISAYWAGFRDYAAAGADRERRPRMWGFQAAGAAPIVVGHRIEHPETVATAIRIGDPASWTKAVEARDASGGPDQRRDRRGDPRRLPRAGPLRGRSSASRPRRPSVAGITQGGRGRRARPRRARRVRADRSRPQGPDDRRAPGPGRSSRPSRPSARSPWRWAGRATMAGHWLAELDGSKVTVEVPASSANLGAGYDCLGVALAITDRIELEVRGLEPGRDRADGRGRGPRRADRGSRQPVRPRPRGGPARRPRRAARRRRLADRRCTTTSRWRAASARPRRRRSAGSWPATPSPARRCRCPSMLVLACEIEGHPGQRRGRAARRVRRVGPRRPRRVEAIRFDSPRDLRAVLFIPELRLPTDEMRGRAAGRRPARRCGGQPRRGRGRGRRPGDRPLRPARPADGRPAPRAVPGRGLSRSCRA